jgi:hypothetical protein
MRSTSPGSFFTIFRGDLRKLPEADEAEVARKGAGSVGGRDKDLGGQSRVLVAGSSEAESELFSLWIREILSLDEALENLTFSVGELSPQFVCREG